MSDSDSDSDSESNNSLLNEQSKMDRVMSWIKVNRLLHDSNSIVLNECMKDVIELFGGNKNILFFITKNSDIKTLQSIHQIITTQTLKYKNKQKTIAKPTTKIQNKETNTINLFSRLLPDECISHICGYLNKKNIKNFKETCRQNAIIAMTEMNKITIGVLNINNLLSPHNELCHFGKQKMIKYSRHSSKKRFCYLYDEWHKQYDIPEHNQLIFKAIIYNRKFELIDSSNQRLLPIKKSTYLICDNRKIVVLDDNKAVKFDPTKHSFKQLQNYKLMLLEYFDIGTQATNIAQFILYKENKVSFNTILDYIEHNFILLNNMSCIWYLELKLMLNQMCYNQNQPKLTIFTHSQYGHHMDEIGHENDTNVYYRYHLNTNTNTSVNSVMDALKTFVTTACLTFQLNYNHPWFNKTNKFDETKLKCAQRMDKFHKSAKEFCQNIQFINIKYFGNKQMLKSSIKYYFKFNSQLNENNTIYTYINKPPKIRLSATSNSTVLRMKISKLFGNIIDAKYIELMDEYHD
eukprot:434433_1